MGKKKNSIYSLFADIETAINTLDVDLSESKKPVKKKTRALKKELVTFDTKEVKPLIEEEVKEEPKPKKEKKTRTPKEKKQKEKKNLSPLEIIKNFWEDYSSGNKEAKSDYIELDGITLYFYIREYAPRVVFSYKEDKTNRGFSLEWPAVNNLALLRTQIDDLASTHKFYALDEKKYKANIDKLNESLRTSYGVF